jgi:cytidylate kinase
MTVVTLSGQTGSGARELGRLAAQRLQIDYVDQEILLREASALGVPVESVASRDERTAGLGERLAAMFRRFLERSAAAGAADPTLGPSGLDLVLRRTYGEAAEEQHEISDDEYLQALTSIIREVAAQGDVLIVGRGSQVILRDWPNALHVLVVAPLEERARYVAERDELSAEEATRRVQESDRGRARFHQKFFHCDVDDPTLYHLTLNTGCLTADLAAHVVVQAARICAPGPQP